MTVSAPATGIMSDARKGTGKGVGSVGVQNEAITIFMAGKRLLALGDIDGAIDQLEMAVQFMVATFGEMGDELAEPYFEYGCALLQACRRDSALFGATGAADDGEEAEDDEVGEEDGGENAGPGSTGEPGPSSASEVPGPSSVSEVPGPSSGPSRVSEPPQEEDDPLDDENVDNFQIAWETLELARHILLRQTTPAAKLRVAEIHNVLGEHNLETDKNEAALEEFQQALRIRTELVDKNSRLIAESLYNVALAQKYCQDYTSARTFVLKAIQVIENRINEIQDKEGLVDSKELISLKGLLPEMQTECKELEKCEAETKMVKSALMSVVSQIKGGIAASAESGQKKISSEPAGASATTIGFGNASTTTIGFGSTTTGDSSGPFNATPKVNNLVVKRRKPKQDVEAPQLDGTVDANAAEPAPTKRAKLEA